MGKNTLHMEEKDFIVPEDEAKAETQALAEAKAEEVRKEIVTALGLTDDDTHKPVIDKAVERELAHRKNLSVAIGQKRNWRDKAKALVPAPQSQQNGTTLDAETVRKQTEASVTEKLEQRDLEEMGLPEDIESEVKKLSQIKGISVRKAAKDPYIVHLIEKAVAEKRIIEAGNSRTPRSTTAAQDGDTPPKFDMSTEQGRKDFNEWSKSQHEKRSK